jgi:LysM repeat protein
VLADTITVPTNECATPGFTVSAAPVTTPLELQPTVVTAGTLPAQPTPQYYVYVVQPGDTLLSILARFGLDASALPDVLRANNLTEDSVIAPGITLYVPTSQRLITLACKITASQALDVRIRPNVDTLVIGTLPIGAEFELIDRSQQTDGVWYAISAQVEGVTVRGAWVRPGAITVPTDCQQAVPGSVITLLPADVPSPVPQQTPTIDR